MDRADPETLSQRLTSGIENLFPGYFAFVMATGIVSVAAHVLDMAWIAVALLAVNIAGYAILSLLFLTRLVMYPTRVVRDLGDHGRGPGFFTVVAGTCVLGAQLLVVAGEPEVPLVLWVVGIVLWALVMYGFFTAVVVRENKPSLEAGLNGA